MIPRSGSIAARAPEWAAKRAGHLRCSQRCPALVLCAMKDRGGSMFVIAVHGGAGTLTRGALSSTQEAGYLDGLSAALDAGHEVLARAGASLDAVVAAVRVLEDNPLFNAGRGSVLNRDGMAELDAS